MEEARRPKARVACAALAALSAVVVWHLIWRVGDSTWPPPSPFTALSRGYWLDLLVLAFAVVLVLPAPRASGVTIGSIREHWKPTLLVCGLPVLVTIAAIPYLRGLPWGGQPSSFWTIQPLAQDLLFFGFVYRVFEAVLSGRHHSRRASRVSMRHAPCTGRSD